MGTVYSFPRINTFGRTSFDDKGLATANANTVCHYYYYHDYQSRYWYRTLAQTYTYLQLTQIGGMPSTKNMKAIKAWYVGCALIRIARLKAIYTSQCAAQVTNVPMHRIGATLVNQLQVPAVQNTLGTR